MNIFVIPDVQARPGDDFSFLSWIGKYIVDKQPDVVVCIGDFADMPSLSSYDKGKKSFEGRRYKKDIEASHEAMKALLGPLTEYNKQRKLSKKAPYKPRMVMTLGNHENRINRAVDEDPMLDGTISAADLKYEEFGWEVYDFLQPVVIEGIAFCHYFTSGVLGRPVGTAQLMLNKKHMSCFAGHQQGRNIAYGLRADGKEMTAIISGSCLAPHHKVLTADLRYVPLLSVSIGDKLVSFDEESGTHGKRGRRYKTGTVTNIRTSVGEMYDVTLSSGKMFRTTKDHKWLTTNCCGVKSWTETQNLQTELQYGKYGTKVSRLFDEWEKDHSREAGWLAGMYDGEGSLYSRKTTGGYCTQLSISQSYSHNPELCEDLVRIHSDFGFNLSGHKTEGKGAGQFRIVGGQSEIAKFLGTIRPSRMLRKFTPELLGNLTTQYPKELESIVSVVSAGVGEYVEIEIDEKTMVVEGYGHHNCYMHEEEYLNPQTNNHWRGCWMLFDVVDGSFDELPLSLRYLEKKYGGV